MDIISLLSTLVEGIINEQEKFYQNPKDLYSFETKTSERFMTAATDFMKMTFEDMDKGITESAYRKGNYTIQRHDERTLITSVGDVVFNQTLFKSKTDGHSRYLLSDMLGLEKHERFSDAAEAVMIQTAVKSSYAEAAKALPTKTGITKTTVMNKIHRIYELPEKAAGEKKKVNFLYIDADEDHIAEQHGNSNKGNNGSFISRLAYVYEDREEVCKKKFALKNVHHTSGLYEGSEGIRDFWEKIGKYIYKNYDVTAIEKIYISGDGAYWIKSGVEYIPESVFVLDKFHLMKYINRAANQMMDESDICKSNIYRMLYRHEQKAFIRYTDLMMKSASNRDAVMDLQTYVINNWKAVMTSLHDKQVIGCSAESHVSHVLSDRMSSRPMSWSQLGADKMSKLRCFVKNNGEEKIIDLVKHTRKQILLKKTGTDAVDKMPYNAGSFLTHGNAAKIAADEYINRLQATIPQRTALKSFSIRNQFRLI